MSGQFHSRALSVAIAPDGNTVAACGGEYSGIGEVKLFDAATGTLREGVPHA